MKLHSHIAHYIRRCGYAMVLTLATGALQAATQEVTIEYLTDAIPTEVVDNSFRYEVDMNLRKPEIPQGTTVWDFNYIKELITDGDCSIRHWAPFRKSDGSGGNWDYGIITPYVQGHYIDEVKENSITVVKDALRKPIQDMVGRKLISYVGAASLRPWTEDRAPLTNVYKHEEGIKFYTKDSKGNLIEKTSVRSVYDENGNLVYHCDDYKPSTLYDKDGQVITPTTDVVYAGKVGDNLPNGRAFIISTDEMIKVHDNKLLIDHSGFGLALGAYAQYGEVYDNVTYIHDVRCSDDISASAAYRGVCHDNTLILVRSEAIGHNVTKDAKEAGAYLSKYNNSGKVLGAWTASLTGNHAYGNRVFVYGSSVYQDVTGAMGGGDMYDNSVFITKSKISIGLHDVNPSYGGYSTRYGKVYDNLFVFDDTFDAIGAGIVEEDMSYYEGSSVAQTSSVQPVSTMHDDIVGGASSRGTGDDAVHNNRVILKGITTKDENGNEVTTTVQSNIFGGIASNNSDVKNDKPGIAGSATNNTVSITGVNILRDVITSVLTDSENNGWTSQQLSINVGCITGGFAGSPVNIRWTPGNANNNIVIVRDSYFENSIYGGRNSAWWSISEKDGEGKEIGHGHASNNIVVLENLRAPVHEDQAIKEISSHDTAVYGGWTEHGKTNNNHVFISGSSNVMNDTMLHGGWGHRTQTAAGDAQEILDKDGNILLPGAHYFDGSNFYTKDGILAGSFRHAQLINDQNGNVVRSEDAYGYTGNLSGFDGRAFYDDDGNDATVLTQPTLVVQASKSGWKGWADYLRYSREIKGEVNENNELVSCDFYVEGSNLPVARFENGSIIKNSGETILKGIARVDVSESANGSIQSARFYDKDDNLIGVIGKFLAEREYESLKNEPPYHRVYQENSLPVAFTGEITENPNGTVTLHCTDGGSYTVQNSAILDADGNIVKEINSGKYIYEDGRVLHQEGSPYSLLSTLKGYAEYDTYTRGNWLHVDGFQGKIKGFDHFEKLHFIVTDDINREEPMLVITGPKEDTKLTYTDLDEGGNEVEKSVKVTADISPIADQLKPGDIIPLIGHEESASDTRLDDLADIPRDSVVDDETTYRCGVTRQIELETEFFEVNHEDDDTTNDAPGFDNIGVIKVLERKESVTPESKVLIEGRIATLTLNNMGGNLVAEQGIDSACRALEGGEHADAGHYVPVEQNGKGGVTYAPKDELEPGNRLFFAMSGAHNKVDSGSDVDVDGTNALVGVSRGFLAKRALTLGAFIETGWGKYHTHNCFGEGANVPTVRGTGETSYVGAGTLLRYHLDNLNRKLDGFSLDASLRAGRQETDYSTPDLMDDYGNVASYEHESDYIAGHVGINYTFQPTEKLAALVYARYLWTHVSNDEGIVCGETVTFEDMHSNRIRLGTRLSWKATEKWTPYLGAAYEWECSGTARATTHGMGITAPSMRGGSVIGEIGAVWQPSLTRALWIEAALQGSVGKNENYGAKLGISIGF